MNLYSSLTIDFNIINNQNNNNNNIINNKNMFSVQAPKVVTSNKQESKRKNIIKLSAFLFIFEIISVVRSQEMKSNEMN